MPDDSTLSVELIYNVDRNHFIINSNAKQPLEIIENFIRTQIGIGGKDVRTRNEYSTYRILIDLDLSTDTFKISDNCGNEDLRNGILMGYLMKYEKYPAP
jgi:hypothetical protein